MIKQYEQYKGSGIDWIGLYPNTWNLVRLRYLCDITTGSRDTIHRDDDGEYPFYVRSKTIERISTYSFDGEAILTAGDGDICKIWHHVNEKFDFHQRVYMLYNFRKIVGRFLYYFISENFYYDVFKLSAKNTVDSLRLPMFHNFPVLVPSIQEQTQIALYLDYQTNIIDQLISKKQKLIELLKEKRQAIINEAVTKGLNPNAKMKDSGIEWLGEVPELWKKVKFKYLAKIRNGKDQKEVQIEDGGYPILGTGGEFGRASAYLYDKPSVLLGRKGTIDKPQYIEVPFWTVDTLFYTEIFNDVVPKYLFYLACQIPFHLLQESSAVPSMTQENLNNVFLCKPSFKEQEVIVFFLESKLNEYDNLISKSITQIEKLKEYRQSIISEAVTGKIDVRDWQAPNN